MHDRWKDCHRQHREYMRWDCSALEVRSGQCSIAPASSSLLHGLKISFSWLQPRAWALITPNALVLVNFDDRIIEVESGEQ